MTWRNLDIEAVKTLLPTLHQAMASGAGLQVRSLDKRVQLLPGVDEIAVTRACSRGVEPALLVRRPDGRFDAWVIHSTAASPEALNLARRAVRVEFGLDPLARLPLHSHIAGFSSGAEMIQATGAPFTRSRALTEYFEVTARASREAAERRLQRVGLTNLGAFRRQHPGLDVDVSWARTALRQGISPREVFLEISRNGRRADALPRSRALHAARSLAAALPPGAVKHSLRTMARALGVPLPALSLIRGVFSAVVKLTVGR